MIRNVGGLDRALRVVVGLALLAMLFLVEGPWRWLGLAGGAMLATAAFSFCPAYTLLGINTCQVKKSA